MTPGDPWWPVVNPPDSPLMRVPRSRHAVRAPRRAGPVTLVARLAGRLVLPRSRRVVGKLLARSRHGVGPVRRGRFVRALLGGPVLVAGLDPLSLVTSMVKVIGAARYIFAVPAATRYGSLTAQTYGGPDSGTTPSGIFAAYQDTAGNADLRLVKVTSSAHAWYTFATSTEAGRVTSARQTVVAIGVDNTYNNATHPDSNFDIGYIRLTIRYYVLQ